MIPLRQNQAFAGLQTMDAHRASVRNSFRLCKAWGRNGSSVIYWLLTEGGLKHFHFAFEMGCPVTNALIAEVDFSGNVVQG